MPQPDVPEEYSSEQVDTDPYPCKAGCGKVTSELGWRDECADCEDERVRADLLAVTP